MQVLADGLEPAGRAVVIHHEFSHVWYSGALEPEPEPEAVAQAQANMKVADAAAAREEEEAELAEAAADVEEAEAEAAEAATDKELDGVRRAELALAERRAEGDEDAIRQAELDLQREVEEEAISVAEQERAEADDARQVAEQGRAEAEGAALVAEEAALAVTRAAAVSGPPMGSFDDFMASRGSSRKSIAASLGIAPEESEAIRREAADAAASLERTRLQKEEGARIEAEQWRMEGICRDANKRGRHKSAAKIQAQYRGRMDRIERRRQKRENVVTIIGLMRGHIYRRRYLQMRDAAVTIQAVGRGLVQRIQLDEQHDAAIRLQAVQRGRSVRQARRYATLQPDGSKPRGDWYQKNSPARAGGDRQHEIYSPDLRHRDARLSGGGGYSYNDGADVGSHLPAAPVAHMMGHQHLPSPRYVDDYDAPLEFRIELESTRLSALQQRAITAQIAVALVEDALDADNPKAALIELILDWEVAGAVPQIEPWDDRRQSSTGGDRRASASRAHRDSVALSSSQQREHAPSPLLSKFRADHAGRPQPQQPQQQPQYSESPRKRDSARRRQAWRDVARRGDDCTSSDRPDEDEWLSLSSSEDSSGSILSSELSDDAAYEPPPMPAVRPRRSSDRPRRDVGAGAARGRASREMVHNDDEDSEVYGDDWYPDELPPTSRSARQAMRKGRSWRSPPQSSATARGAESPREHGRVAHRRPRRMLGRGAVETSESNLSTKDAAASVIQAGGRAFLLRSRLGHRVSQELTRQIRYMEDLHASMLEEMDTLQHHDSDQLLLTRVEGQLERKKQELAMQLSNPRTARARIRENKAAIPERSMTLPASASSRSGAAAHTGSRSSSRSQRQPARAARSPTRQERVEAAREKQRRMAAAAQRSATVAAAPMSAAAPSGSGFSGSGGGGLVHSNRQRSPQRAAPPPQPTEYDERPVGGSSSKPRSFLKRGGGRSAGVAGATLSRARPSVAAPAARQLARGSPQLRVQEVYEAPPRSARSTQQHREQQQRDEIHAAARRAQERLESMLQAELRQGSGGMEPAVVAAAGGSGKTMPPGVKQPESRQQQAARQQASPPGGSGSGKRSSGVSRLAAKDEAIARALQQYEATTGLARAR